jgi:hypothetical protein
MALSDAERAARYRERRKEGTPAVHYRKPADRRTRPQKWRDAVQALTAILDDYERWQDNLPESLAASAMVERIEEVLELRTLVDQLHDAQLPKGFGRD